MPHSPNRRSCARRATTSLSSRRAKSIVACGKVLSAKRIEDGFE
jgi:hypothetical protein